MPEHSLISAWTQLRLGWDPVTLTVAFIGRPLPHPSSFLHCLLRPRKCSWNLYTSPTLISYPNRGKMMGRGKGRDHTPREFLAPSGCVCQWTEVVPQPGVKNRVECKEFQRHCSTEKNRQRARASVQSQDCHPKGWGSRGIHGEPWACMNGRSLQTKIHDSHECRRPFLSLHGLFHYVWGWPLDSKLMGIGEK